MLRLRNLINLSDTLVSNVILSLQIVHEWYFAKPNWKVESLGFQGVQHQVLLRFDSFTKRGHNIMSVFNFNPDAGEPTLFDIKPCFTREEQRVVWFSLHGKDVHCYLLAL